LRVKTMKNPFLKGADPLGSRRSKMAEIVRKWKPVGRSDRPDRRDFPILIWRSAGKGWEIWQNDRQADAEWTKTDRPVVWISLPKEPD